MIQVNDEAAYGFTFWHREKGDPMPTETAIVVAGIILVFAVFVVTMAWADYYTSRPRHPDAAE